MGRDRKDEGIYIQYNGDSETTGVRVRVRVRGGRGGREAAVGRRWSACLNACMQAKVHLNEVE